MSTTMANKATVVRKWYILDAAGKPTRMNKAYPELYGILKNMQEKENTRDGTA